MEEKKENEAVFFNALDIFNQAKNTTNLTQKEALAKKAIELFESIAGYSGANSFLQQAKELILETSKKAEENERTRKENERKREEAERMAMQQRGWRNAGCCQHCGGELRGFFSKKCVSCGKPKDY